MSDSEVPWIPADQQAPTRRLRLQGTAEGQFRTCLFALEETDLRAIVRSATDDADDRLAEAIAAAVGTKWAGHHIGRDDFVRPARSMSQIGG